MGQTTVNRGVRHPRLVLVICAVFAVVIGVLYFRRADRAARNNEQYRKSYGAAMLRAQIENNLHVRLRHIVYFESLGASIDRGIPAPMHLQITQPRDPRALRKHPTLKEMERSLGPVAIKEGETSIWIFRPGGSYETRISANFESGKLSAATFEIGPFQEHLGPTPAEWQWHGVE